MKSGYVEFHRCTDVVSLEHLQETLRAADIPFVLASTSRDVGSAWMTIEQPAVVIVSVPPDRLPAAREAMDREYLLMEPPPEHYLHGLSDEELLAIPAEASTWSAYDVAHARRMIEARGIDPKAAEAVREKRLQTLRAGRPVPGWMLFVGWICVALGGFIGMGLGWSIATQKTTTPDGTFPVYDAESRWMGRLMQWIGVVIFAAFLGLRFRYLMGLSTNY